MTKTFAIKKKDKLIYILLLAHDGISSVDIDSINKNLKKRKYKGNVILDFKINNGDAFNRFIQLPFNGRYMDLSATKVISLSGDIKQFCDNFYSSIKMGT